MEKFKTLTSVPTPLDRTNVDTDQIIPKQFLKRIERTGYEDFLFFDWRQNPDGTKIEDFPLNDQRFKGSRVLIAGKNFGCGSSREHAVWALSDFGFRAVIAPSFADIFANNSAKNGFLNVTLQQEEVSELMRRCQLWDGYCLTVDLEQKKVCDQHGFEATFPIDDFTRHCLLQGLDDIALTLQHESEIVAYEKVHPLPWHCPAAN